MGVAKDVVGTPPFMAPEALQMQALDARADLFSLGALGYCLLTGRHALSGAQAWRAARRVALGAARRQRLAPELPAALDQLVM